MNIKLLPYSFLACFALGCAAFAHADTIATFVPDSSDQAPDSSDYEGNFFDGSSAIDPITIGTFDFTIPPGDLVAGATVSGTFGDADYPDTALIDLYFDGIQVAGCDSPTAPCATNQNPPLADWSHTFTSTELSELSSGFSSGVLDFTGIQKSAGVAVIGAPTLDLHVVPEPGSLLTLAGGLLAMAVWRRRK